MNKPLVSVAIPTYKRTDNLFRLLDCLADQTYKNFEVIISDNDPLSKINFQDYYEGKLNIKYYKNTENIGLLRNTIKLVDLAKGELFCWISDDDLRTNRFLERLVKQYIESGRSVLSTTDFIEVDEKLNHVSLQRKSKLRNYRFLQSRNKVVRRLGFYFQDQRFGKCNIFYGLFETSWLKNIDLERISDDFKNYSFDNFLVYSAIKEYPVVVDQEAHIYLTVENTKHYSLGKSSTSFFIEYITDLMKYIRLSSVLESFFIGLIFPMKILKDLTKRLVDKLNYFFPLKKQNPLYQDETNSKLKLDNVTLVIVATKNVEASLAAYKYSKSQVGFGETKFFSHYCPAGLKKSEYTYVDPFSSVEEWGKFIIYELHKYICTDYILLIHSDGFVVNADSWSDCFFDYDYIGAPWPLPKDNFSYRTPSGKLVRVGNSVSLRSKKILEAPSKLQLPWERFHGFLHEDGFLCVQHYDELRANGICFADIDVAKDFSREYVDIKSKNEPFVFHKWKGKNQKYPFFENI